MKRIVCGLLVCGLAACARPVPATDAQADPSTGVLRLLSDLADAPPIDAALVERATGVHLVPKGSEMAGTRPLAHGLLSVSLAQGSTTIMLPGKLPDTPCVLALGALLDQANALGYQTSFYDMGSKPAWTLTKEGSKARSVGLNVMTNPPTTSQTDPQAGRTACVGYISAATEAKDEQALP